MRSSVVFALSLALLNGNAATTPPVKLALRSSWPAPPLLVEVLESVSLENPEAFFPLLSILSKPENILHSQTLTSEAVHQYVLQTALDNGFISDPGSLAAVKMGLALHAATPKIEAFYEHYADYKERRVESEHTECDSWVDWYGNTVCDIETLVHLAGIETIESANGTHPSFIRPKILPFDHIYPPPSRALEHPPRTAILYSSLTSPTFWDLHTYLLSLANKPEPHVEYVFRHIPSGPRNHSERNSLSGYGVALDLKKMDYLALDDRHSHHGESDEKVPSKEPGESPPDFDPIISLLQAYPENPTAADATSPLTSDELFEIGLQSTQLLADSLNPFHTLTQLSQNFPKYATSIARRVIVNESLAAEVRENHIKAEAGVNMFWLNGVVVNARDINPFGLLRLLRKERNLMLSLTSLGLTRGQAIELLTHPAIATAQSSKGVLDGLFDASDRPEGGDVIIWWNDFEKDNRYARWNPNLSALLRPTFPGQFHNVKSNLFNVVLVLDLSQTSSLNFIAGAVANIIDRHFPFRFGVVPITETEEGTQMARLFYYLIKQYGRAKTMGYFKRIAQLTVPLNLLAPTTNWDLARYEYEALLSTETPREEGVVTDFDSIINGALEVPPAPVEQTRMYAERLGADLASASQGHAFVNGKHMDMDDNFLRSMQVEVGQQLQHLQEQLYEGQLTESNTASMANYFYDLPEAVQRRNRYLFPGTAGSLRIFNLPELFSKSGFSFSHESFIYPPQVESVPLSMFIVADLNSDSGSSLIKEVLNSIDAESLTRVSFIHNPTHPMSDLSTGSRISWVISHLLSIGSLSKASPVKVLRALSLDASMIASEDPQVVLSQEGTLQELAGGIAVGDFNASAYTKYVKSSRLVARELQLAPGELALLVNGRVIGPFKSGEFVSADLKALETYEFRRRAEPVIQALESLDRDKPSFGHLVSMSTSIISAIQLPDPSENGLFDTAPRPRQRNYQLLSGNHTLFTSGDNSTALYHVAVLLEPLSESAQRLSSLLEWLSTLPDIFVELHINPAHYSELPLKRFYRYNILPSLLFGEDGSEIPAQAVFHDLPVDPIYTLAMDVPPSWLVRPREALYDLDNIQLGKLSPEDHYRGVEALFDLDYLVVEGHARDKLTSAPPRGVQLQLTNRNSTPIDDTQVVANLGYLQFKAKPGVFKLEIRDGRGREIFQMESVGNDGWHSPTVEEVGNEIALTSFEGLTIYPRFVRIPGMETADVLAEVETLDTKEPRGFFDDIASSVTSIFKAKPKGGLDVKVRSNDQADINIFTVASGLLYERFVAIMILSVLRNTNSTVKFWFIENFLSPSFLEFIPHLAEAYGFKYELVTYKWPSWLRAQKEKQRIIWAYKILFLDVLFPMDLKKVIFVDADQIVRADLKELVDLDLQGAPYGYTPMGDDNTDMEGFRFWKTGYWRDFLQGRPYHISALYVVDLVRFRQMAAGDILRGQYQQLSADPNSLANLDQDLPNNLQREVPIFSLHEDWLWCETWCSKDRLHRAKTIDLCQNPLTKEPKLARARQIPEWEEYDSEISRFARKLAEEGLIRSWIATADVNALANAGVVQKAPSPAEVQEEYTQPEVEHKRDEL